MAGCAKKTVWAIAIIGALRLALIFCFDLTPQEAYYWNFGRHPALGYYDHPSVMPWTIFLTTRIFGDTRFGIRLGAWGYGLGALAFLYLIARKLWDERTAFWAVVFAGAVPLFNVAGIFFTPDPPLIFFYLGATYFLLLAVQTGRWSHWLLAGL
ncbi:glycosyltransferase family 39 protein, partial [bacterium]|nr:glycosyltransferase family 39 protein [bacterium]